MPHYVDGTPVQVGDVVKGQGYNVKHEIVGTVVDVRPGDSCTLSVAHTSVLEIPEQVPWSELYKYGQPGQLLIGRKVIRVEVEYGDTKGFNKVA